MERGRERKKPHDSQRCLILAERPDLIEWGKKAKE
jgi:hypothetical protein